MANKNGNLPYFQIFQVSLYNAISIHPHFQLVGETFILYPPKMSPMGLIIPVTEAYTIIDV
jgi:hypothetical protein